jgi:biopolymer transport protein ExbB
MAFKSASLFELIAMGGISMIPLVFLSILTVTVVVKKAVEFQLARIGAKPPHEALARYRETGDLVAFAHACDGVGSPVSSSLAVCARSLALAPERAEDDVRRHVATVLLRLEAQLALLSFTAQVAPLFGLLGTVIGMVQLFAAMDAGGAQVQTSMLASGIWEALLTTAAGLIIAIPALAGYLWLTRRTDALRVVVDSAAGDLLSAFAVHRARAKPTSSGSAS